MLHTHIFTERRRIAARLGALVSFSVGIALAPALAQVPPPLDQWRVIGAAWQAGEDDNGEPGRPPPATPGWAWRGIWHRIPNTNYFEAEWEHAGSLEKNTATMRVIIDNDAFRPPAAIGPAGLPITIERSSAQGTCIYSGTIRTINSRLDAQGTAKCQFVTRFGTREETIKHWATFAAPPVSRIQSGNGPFGVWATRPETNGGACSIQYVASSRPNPRYENPRNGYTLVRTAQSKAEADLFLSKFDRHFDNCPDGVVKMTPCPDTGWKDCRFPWGTGYAGRCFPTGGNSACPNVAVNRGTPISPPIISRPPQPQAAPQPAPPTCPPGKGLGPGNVCMTTMETAVYECGRRVPSVAVKSADPATGNYECQPPQVIAAPVAPVAPPAPSEPECIFVLDVAGGSVWVGRESDLRNAPTCHFGGGGLCSGGGKDPLVRQLKKIGCDPDARAKWCQDLRGHKVTRMPLTGDSVAEVYGGKYWIGLAPSCPTL